MQAGTGHLAFQNFHRPSQIIGVMRESFGIFTLVWSNTIEAVSLFIFGNYLRSSRDDLEHRAMTLTW